MLPDLAVIVRLLVPFGVTGWFDPDEQPARMMKESTATAIPRRVRVRYSCWKSKKNKNTIKGKSTRTTRGLDIRETGMDRGGTRAVVVTESCAVTAVTPSAGVTVAGIIE